MERFPPTWGGNKGFDNSLRNTLGSVGEGETFNQVSPDRIDDRTLFGFLIYLKNVSSQRLSDEALKREARPGVSSWTVRFRFHSLEAVSCLPGMGRIVTVDPV